MCIPLCRSGSLAATNLPSQPANILTPSNATTSHTKPCKHSQCQQKSRRRSWTWNMWRCTRSCLTRGYSGGGQQMLPSTPVQQERTCNRYPDLDRILLLSGSNFISTKRSDLTCNGGSNLLLTGMGPQRIPCYLRRIWILGLRGMG